MPALRQVLPILVVLAAVIALGYPLALVFGLPLARRDLSDLRKWRKEKASSIPGSCGGKPRALASSTDWGRTGGGV